MPAELEAEPGAAAPELTPSPDPADGARSIRRNAAALGVGQMFTWAMTLAWTLVVPRLLGADGMGMIVTGMSVTAMLQIALGAGTATYVTREVVVSPQRAARIVASASLARLLLVPVFGVTIVVWALLAHYSARQNEVLFLCGGATAVMLLGEPLLSYFQATERMHYIAIGDAINKASQGLGGILLAVAGYGAFGFAVCWVITATLVVVLSVRWARRYIDLRWRTRWSDLKAIAVGSAVYWTGGLFFTIYAWIDTAMLSVMTNPTVVAWYGVPMRLWGTFLIIPSIVSRVYLPQMVAAHERSQSEFRSAARLPVGVSDLLAVRERSQDAFRRVARTPIEMVFVMSLPVATLIALAAAPGVRLVFGSGYVHATPVLIILGLNLVPMYLNIMLATVCVATGRQGTWNWLLAGATLFNPAINAILIPLTQHQFGNGAIGAAIALALTELIVAVVALAIVGRRIGVMPIGQRGLRMALACGATWLVGHLLASVGAVPSVLVACLVLGVLVTVLRAITPEERRQMLRGVARVTARAGAPLARLRRGRRAPEAASHDF